MASVSSIDLAIRKEPNTDREYIPTDTVQFNMVNAVSLKGLTIPTLPTISDITSIKYSEKGLVELRATTATDFTDIADGLSGVDPLILPYSMALTISGLPLNGDLQPHNGVFYITSAYQEDGEYVLLLSNPSITTDYFDTSDQNNLDLGTFVIGVADYYEVFEQKNSENSVLNGPCHGQYVEAYLPERYLTLDPDVQAVAFADKNMILYSDTKRFSTESASLDIVEAKWDSVEEKVYLLTNLLDVAGQDQFNLIKVGDRLRVDLVDVADPDPDPDIRFSVTEFIDKVELTDDAGNKYGQIWLDVSGIIDSSYDYDKIASATPNEYIVIANMYTSRPKTLLFVDGTLTNRIHDSDVTIDTHENLVIPGQYYELSFISSETFTIGATNTPSAILSSYGGKVDSVITEKPSGGGFATEMCFGDLTDMMLEATLGGQWTENLITDGVTPIGGSDIIEVADLNVGAKLRVGYPIRLSGSEQYVTVNQSKRFVNNGVFIITAIKTYGGPAAVYQFKVSKSLYAPLGSNELFISEPVNPNYMLQQSVCENGLLAQSFKVEKTEYANTPFVALFSGQQVQAMNVTMGAKAIITMDVTMDGTGYQGNGRIFPYKGNLIKFLGSDANVISAASQNNVFIKNGVAAVLNSFTWSATGLTDIQDAIGTPFSSVIARSPLTTETKYSLDFSNVYLKQKYLAGCLEEDLLFTIGNSPECENIQAEDAYVYYSIRNCPANLTTATKAQTGQLLLDFQSGYEKIRMIGDDFYGKRQLVCSWSRFPKIV